MNIIEIVGLLFLASGLVCIISIITLFFDDINNIEPKEDKITFITFIISLIIAILSFTIMIIYSIKNPQPTFREVCEANNGTYIENHGRAGNSCIYNR